MAQRDTNTSSGGELAEATHAVIPPYRSHREYNIDRGKIDRRCRCAAIGRLAGRSTSWLLGGKLRVTKGLSREVSKDEPRIEEMGQRVSACAGERVVLMAKQPADMPQAGSAQRTEKPLDEIEHGIT